MYLSRFIPNHMTVYCKNQVWVCVAYEGQIYLIADCKEGTKLNLDKESNLNIHVYIHTLSTDLGDHKCQLCVNLFMLSDT